MDTGEVKTFDLLCLKLSQYMIPDMWTAHLRKMAASGFGPKSVFLHFIRLLGADISCSDVALDIVAHPRDLNLVFIVYGGMFCSC